jgi:hypothetical protein
MQYGVTYTGVSGTQFFLIETNLEVSPEQYLPQMNESENGSLLFTIGSSLLQVLWTLIHSIPGEVGNSMSLP